MDRLTRAYLDLGCGLSTADAMELARRELEMRKQFQADWKSGRVRHEEKLYAAAMKRQHRCFVQTVNKGRRPPSHSKPCRDFDGNSFKSVKAMCEFYKIGVNVFVRRRQHDWSLKDALTTPVIRTYTDHVGRVFKTEVEMCKAWGVNVCTYRLRIRKGLDIKTALTKTPHQGRCSKGVTDPDGRKFESVKAMCKAWGVRYLTYHKRIKNGADLRTALKPTGHKLRGLFKELEAFVKE